MGYISETAKGVVRNRRSPLMGGELAERACEIDVRRTAGPSSMPHPLQQ